MWQTTVILLPGVGEPGAFLCGVTSIPVDPLDPVDPVDPLESSERAPMYCKNNTPDDSSRKMMAKMDHGPWRMDHGP